MFPVKSTFPSSFREAFALYHAQLIAAVAAAAAAAALALKIFLPSLHQRSLQNLRRLDLVGDRPPCIRQDESSSVLWRLAIIEFRSLLRSSAIERRLLPFFPRSRNEKQHAACYRLLRSYADLKSSAR